MLLNRLRVSALAFALAAVAASPAIAQAPTPEIDVQEVRARAEANDPQAQTTLGTLYQLGQGGLKADYKEALKWFQRAAQQGEPGAMYRLGYMYYSGQGVPQNVPEAVRWFKKSACEGFAVAQYTLGRMFSTGQGVPQNHSEALRWFYHAAEQGYAPAQHQVGAMIFQGHGAPQDYLEACKWFYIAAANGEEQGTRGIEFALQLVGRDDLAKASELAKEFKARPPRKVPEKLEPPPIYHELLSKAKAGQPQAQYELSLLLQSGSPTTEDLKEARRWIFQAAVGGHAEAQHQLGSMYFLGQGGLLKDYVAAYKWLSLAANGGRTNAIEGRERVAAAMTPQQLAEARRQIAAFKPTTPAAVAASNSAGAKPPETPSAAKTTPVPAAATPAPAPTPPTSPPASPPAAQPPAPAPAAKTAPPTPSFTSPSANPGATTVELRREAEQGKVDAQLALGLIYLHGKGVTANRDEARKWLEKSASQGHAPAQYWLATTFEAAQQAERVKWLRRAADGGFGLAQFMVGQMYFSGGQGVPQDVVEAYKWLHLASRQGNPAADAVLETVVPVMTSEQIEEAKRRADEVAFRLKAGK